MRTNKKTIEVIDGFTLKAFLHSWNFDIYGYNPTTYNVAFKDRDTGREFTLPVNEEFMKQLQAGTNQMIEMEIRFLERK